MLELRPNIEGTYKSLIYCSGLDEAESILKNLKVLIKNKNFVSSLIQNVAAIYTLKQMNFDNSVMLNYDSNLNNIFVYIGNNTRKKNLFICIFLQDII